MIFAETEGCVLHFLETQDLPIVCFQVWERIWAANSQNWAITALTLSSKTWKRITSDHAWGHRVKAHVRCRVFNKSSLKLTVSCSPLCMQNVYFPSRFKPWKKERHLCPQEGGKERLNSRGKKAGGKGSWDAAQLLQLSSFPVWNVMTHLGASFSHQYL